MYQQPHTRAKEMPRELRDALGTEMDQDEHLLWAGQPDPARMAWQALPLVIFGIPWTAFSVFWVGAAAAGASRVPGAGFFLLFPLFGLPFVLVGLGMLSSPYWARRHAQRTAYGITDRRVLILTLGKTRKVETYAPEHLSRFERADGTGDLIFQKRVGRDSDGGRTVEKKGFWGIPDVRAVERLLRDTFSDRDDRGIPGASRTGETSAAAAPHSRAPW